MTSEDHAKWMMGAAMAIVGAATSACADLKRASGLEPSGVNIESPVASTVADDSQRSYPSPHFKALPLRPAAAEIRKPASFKTDVADLDGKEASLQAWKTANPPFILDQGEPYAQTQRGRFPTAVGADAPPPDSTALTEAWAAARRAAAQPPPAPK